MWFLSSVVIPLIAFIFDFLWTSLVLLFSGFLSLLITIGLVSCIAFFVIRRLQASGSTDAKEEDAVEKDVATSVDDGNNRFTAYKQTERKPPCGDDPLSDYPNNSDDNDNKTLNYEPGIINLDRLKEEFFGDTVATNNYDESVRHTNGYHRDEEVRQFMERLVETLISSNLDDSSLDTLNDVCYETIHEKYCKDLSEILSKLSGSLHSTIDNKPLDDSEKPSTIYVQLKSLIKQIFEDATSVTPTKISNHSKKESGVGSSITANCVDGKSYEDILSSLVITRIILKNEDQLKKSSHDVECLTGIEKQIEDITDQTDSLTDSSIVDKEMSLTVEEHIEEITTTTTTKYASSSLSEEDADEEGRPEGRISGLAKFLSGLNFLAGRRAEFPELGRDIVDGTEAYDADNDDFEDGEEFESDYYDDDEDYNNNNINDNNNNNSSNNHDRMHDYYYQKESDSSGYGVEMVSAIDSWQDNWLFQRKKFHVHRTAQQEKHLKQTTTQTIAHHTIPVPMLVPNPSHDYRALIGDVDADEISDLSECSDSVLEELIHSTNSTTNTTTTTVTSTPIDTNKSGKYAENEPKIPWYRISLTGRNKCSVDSSCTTDQDSSGVASISRDVSELYNTTSSPSEDDGSSSLSWTGIKNASPLLQDDSGEGSLEGGGQQDNEYVIHVESSHNHRVGHSDDESKANAVDRSQKYLSDSLEPVIHFNENGTSSPTTTTDDSVGNFKPGSIAEREHLKWQQAAPLPNNPYSKENIEKRSLDRLLLTRSYSANDKHSLNILDTEPGSIVKIDCGASLPDCRKYGRDYYINGKNEIVEQKKSDSRTNLNRSLSARQNTPVTVKERTASSNGSGSEDGSTKKKIGKLVHVSSWSDRKNWDRQNYTMPSVKELAKQFDESTQKREYATTPGQRSPKQVHSLTARSMSKEFREGLKYSCKRTFNRNVMSLSESSSEKPIVYEEHNRSSEDSGNASPTESKSSPITKLNEHVKFWKTIDESTNSSINNNNNNDNNFVENSQNL